MRVLKCGLAPWPLDSLNCGGFARSNGANP